MQFHLSNYLDIAVLFGGEVFEDVVWEYDDIVNSDHSNCSLAFRVLAFSEEDMSALRAWVV